MRKRILTGITTTGTPHIGNYIGAIKPALELVAPDNDSYFFLADYHALIKQTNPAEIEASGVPASSTRRYSINGAG